MVVGVPQLVLSDSPHYVFRETTVRRLRSRRCWALLSYLAAHGGWCERASVASALWPDSPEARRRHNLRQTILYTREGLPGADRWLELDGTAIRLDRQEIAIQLSDIGSSASLGSHRFDDVQSWDPNEVFNLDPDTRRSAAIGLTPAWIALGKMEEGLREVAQLRILPRFAGDPDLAICEIELLVYLHQLEQARQAGGRLSTSQLRTDLRARLETAICFCDGRQDNHEGAVEHGTIGFRLAHEGGDMVTAKRSALMLAAVQPLGNRRWIERGISLCDHSEPDPWRPSFEFLSLRTDVGEGLPLDVGRANKAIAEILSGRTPGLNGITVARIGRLFEQAGYAKEALEAYERTIEVLRPTDLARELSEALTYLGDLLRQEGEPARSLAAHLEAVTLRRGLHDPVALATSLRGAGMAAQMLGHWNQAKQYLREALSLYETVIMPLGAALTAIPLARLWAKQGRWAKAADIYRLALRWLHQVPEGERTLSSPTDMQSIEAIEQELAEVEARPAVKPLDNAGRFGA